MKKNLIRHIKLINEDSLGDVYPDSMKIIMNIFIAYLVLKNYVIKILIVLECS